MKKYEYPLDLGWRLAIQPPSGRHKSYRVIKRWDSPAPDVAKHQSINDEALDAINQRLVTGTLTVTVAYKEAELLVERLYRDAGVKRFKSVSNGDNQRLLDAFWEEYPNKRQLADPESGYAKYRRAVEAVGEISLLSGSEKDLQVALDKLPANKQRESVGRLLTVLRWLKRTEVILQLKKAQYRDVKYLTHSEMEAMLCYIKNDTVKLCCRVARGTGARIGELMFMKADAVQDKSVFIKRQILRTGEEKSLKSKQVKYPGRRAYVLPEARPLLKRWCLEKIKLDIKLRRNLANIVRAACECAFPSQPEKWIKFHDLRHSYAIELAQNGISLLQISQQIGDSERVCQEHYLSHMASTESIDIIDIKMRGA